MEQFDSGRSKPFRKFRLSQIELYKRSICRHPLLYLPQKWVSSLNVLATSFLVKSVGANGQQVKRKESFLGCFLPQSEKGLRGVYTVFAAACETDGLFLKGKTTKHKGACTYRVPLHTRQHFGKNVLTPE